MVCRVLPPTEWDRVRGLDVGLVLDGLNPETTQIVIVEQDGAIVGCWTALRVVHAEGVWIDPAYRGNVRVVKALLAGMGAAAHRWGVRTIVTSAITDGITRLIARLGGTELPGRHFVLPVLEGEQSCPSAP